MGVSNWIKCNTNYKSMENIVQTNMSSFTCNLVNVQNRYTDDNKQYLRQKHRVACGMGDDGWISRAKVAW